jgi:hypothetical protein
MVIRTYFDKNNTIIKDSPLNTGKNPITELYYGTDVTQNRAFSRFMFYISLDKLKKYFKGVDGVKHTLKMTNTGVFNNDLLNKTTSDGKKRTSSFKLQLFRIYQDWDEGTGYDFFKSKDGSYSDNPSNFTHATTTEPWRDEAFEFLPMYTQHFDAGNENLEIDITNLIDLDNDDDISLGVSFVADIEALDIVGLHYVGFFTRHTQSFYQPYIESKTINSIKDDRPSFQLNKPNKLYFINKENGVPTNLVGEVYVDIMKDNEIYLSNLPTKQERTGLYSVEVNIPSGEADSEDYFMDQWYNKPTIQSEPIKLADLYFTIKENLDDRHNTGYFIEPKHYRLDVSGIKYNEQVKRGDVRQVIANPIVPYTVHKSEVSVDKIEYRLYVKEGHHEHTVTDFHPLDMDSNNNYLLLDTDSLLPNTYYMDIKTHSGMEVRQFPSILKFEIVG